MGRDLCVGCHKSFGDEGFVTTRLCKKCNAKKELYFKRQLRGLWLIMDDSKGGERNDGNMQVSPEYVQEKLEMIMSGFGIGFHPVITNRLDYLEKEGKL